MVTELHAGHPDQRGLLQGLNDQIAEECLIRLAAAPPVDRRPEAK